MVGKVVIWFRRRRARALARAVLENEYQRFLDAAETLGCGHTLAMHISKAYYTRYSNLIKAWDKVKVLDPDAPDLFKSEDFRALKIKGDDI